MNVVEVEEVRTKLTSWENILQSRTNTFESIDKTNKEEALRVILVRESGLVLLTLLIIRLWLQLASFGCQLLTPPSLSERPAFYCTKYYPS